MVEEDPIFWRSDVEVTEQSLVDGMEVAVLEDMKDKKTLQKNESQNRAKKSGEMPVTVDLLYQVRDHLEQKINVNHGEVGREFHRMNGRISELEGRMDKLESRMDKLEGRMDKLESRMDKLEGRMDKLEARMGRLEDKIDGIEAKIDQFFSKIRETLTKQSVEIENKMPGACTFSIAIIFLKLEYQKSKGRFLTDSIREIAPL